MKTIHFINMLFIALLASITYPIQAQLNKEAIEFKKTVEPNLRAHGLYNTSSKTSLQKKLSVDENAMIEFFIEPSFSGASGLMINYTTDSGYTLDIKWVSNWEEVQKKMETDFPAKPATREMFKNMSEDEKKSVLKYNRTQYSKRYSGAISEYIIENKVIPISESLAKQFHKSYITLIGNHVNKGVPNISRDGYTAVSDVLWEMRCGIFQLKIP